MWGQVLTIASVASSGLRCGKWAVFGKESPGFCFRYLWRLEAQSHWSSILHQDKTTEARKRVFTSPCPGAVPERSMVTRIMFVLHLAVENRRVLFAQPESFFDEQAVGILHVSPAL